MATGSTCMREIELLFIVEVTDPKTGHTTRFPRMSDYWCTLMERYGYIVINTEEELP